MKHRTRLLATVIFAGTSAAHAQITGNWNSDAPGSWGSASLWTSNPDIPGATAGGGDVAILDFNITASRAITLDGARRLGKLVIGDPDSTNFYSISAGTDGALIFDAPGAGTATLHYPANIGSNTISAPITLEDDLRVFFTGTNPLTSNIISGVVSGNGSLTFDNDDGITPAEPAAGVGQFSLNRINTFTGGVNINDVRVQMGNGSAFGSGLVTVADGGSVWVNVGQFVPASFHLTGEGWLEALGKVGAMRMTGNPVIQGNITLVGAPGDSAGTQPDASIYPLMTSGSTANWVPRIDGIISGGDLLVGSMSTGTGTATHTGTATLSLTNANTYGDTIIRPLDAPTAGRLIVSVGNSTDNTTATLGSGPVYLIGGAGGMTSALRIWRGGGYQLAQDVVTTSGPTTKTSFFADVTDSGLTLNGHSVTVTDQVVVGASANGAVLNIDENSVIQAGRCFTGSAANNSATVNQTGGEVTVSGHLRVADAITETSAWNMAGGKLTLTGQPTANPFMEVAPYTEDTTGMGTLYIGVEGQGLFQQTGGEVSAAAIVLDNRIGTINGPNMATGIDQYVLGGGLLKLGNTDPNGNWDIQGNPSADTTVTAVLAGGLPIEKSGTATVTLANANSYTGSTTVKAGTLKLQQPYLSDISAVTVDSGAMLHLDFTGNDVIAYLKLGAANLGPGIYSAATHPDFIAGTGSLEVVTSPGTYSGWAALNSVTGGMNADDDNDGVANGIEFFMGDTSSGFTAMPAPDGNGKVTWPKGAAYKAAYGSAWEIQTSTDLQTWHPAAEAEVQISPAAVSYTLPAGQGQIFARLRVLGPQ